MSVSSVEGRQVMGSGGPAEASGVAVAERPVAPMVGLEVAAAQVPAVVGATGVAALDAPHVAALKSLATSGRLWAPDGAGHLQRIGAASAFERLSAQQEVVVLTVVQRSTATSSHDSSSHWSQEHFFSTGASADASSNSRSITQTLAFAKDSIRSMAALALVEEGLGVKGIGRISELGGSVTMTLEYESRWMRAEVDSWGVFRRGNSNSATYSRESQRLDVIA